MKAFFKALHGLWLKLKWWWQDGLRSAQLQDKGSEERDEAEEAIARIVYETNIATDCVAATTLRGGPAIVIKHDKAQEGFVGKSYMHAAEKAIEWLTEREGRFILQGKTSGLNRKQRRADNAARKRHHSSIRKRLH